MSTHYILISDEEIADLVNGKEVYFSVPSSQNGSEFAIMLDQAFKDAYLGKTEEDNDG